MAEEEKKELNPKFIVLWDIDGGGLAYQINKSLEKGYVPYGNINRNDGLWFTSMVDPSLKLVTIDEITEIKKGTMISTVTIPGTVNVSGCECNCG